MKQYIDKDALVAEIKRRMDENEGKQILPQYFGMVEEDLNILYYIDTLEVKEVDLDEEIKRFTMSKELYETKSVIRTVAKHFFELGLSVSNSTKVTIPDIDDILKGNGVNPYSKEAKIIKESYYMAIEKLTQKGEEHEV